MNDILLQISKLDFCIQEVTLFLDTHPGNKEAMHYYKEASELLNNLKRDYLCNGGVLTNRDGKGLNNYINEPFPWVGDKQCGCMKNACNFL